MNLKDVKFKSPGCCRGKLSGKKFIPGLFLLAVLLLGIYGSRGIELVSFKANHVNGKILLQWETASETNNAGFHTWRSEKKDVEYTRITESIIPSEGGASNGAEYSYNDVKVTPGKTYYYKLQNVYNNGKTRFHGPVEVTVPGDDR